MFVIYTWKISECVQQIFKSNAYGMDKSVSLLINSLSIDQSWNLIAILPCEEINKFHSEYLGHIPISNILIPFLIAKLLLIVL